MLTRRAFLAGAAAAAASAARPAAVQASWRAGVARADITPAPGIWMAGFAARTSPATGTALPLHARALAIERGGARLLLLTVDLLGVTAAMRERIGARLRRSHGVEPEAWLLASSHTHCGPVVDDQLSVAYALDAGQRRRIAAYTAELESTLARIGGDALDRLEPAALAMGRAQAGFGANRRTQFLPPGPVDPSVPVLRVSGSTGRPLAIVFGYACHNTTLQAAMTEFHGDYAGVAAREIEQRQTGAQAMFLAGCGADVNPSPRGTLALVEQHGRTLADAVDRALGTAVPVDGTMAAALETVDLPFAPQAGRGHWLVRAADPDPFVRRHAALMLERLERDGRLETAHRQPVQVWRLGQMLLVALGGEVVADYALRLSREHASAAPWVAAYANDVSCYIPSGRVLQEGGYEGGGAMLYYGRPGPFDASVEQRLVAAAAALMRRVGAS